jgi:2-polyprenyl-3-methyl-5-hydroxy-6-metoxy-1,4-benzoquinol methylase
MTSRFDEKAADWDTEERQERVREVAAIIRRHVPLTSAMRVIDIGAGTGLLGLELAPDVAAVVLAEPSAGMLSVARSKLSDGGYPTVTAIELDLPADPPPEAPFDLAVSLLMLHHVEDTRATLSSIHALLAPGGRIALLDLDAEDGSFHEEDAEGIHHHGFDQVDVARLAESVGFEEVESRNVSEIERDGRAYAVFLLTGRKPEEEPAGSEASAEARE